METTQEVVTQAPPMQASQAVLPGENQAGETARLRRPPRPSGELSTGETTVESRLKSERVEEMLRQMPGWKLLPGGRAVDRVRELATPEIAADYAAWVLRSAARLGRCVGVRLAGSRCLTITLEGRSGSRRRSLSETDLNFAKSLG